MSSLGDQVAALRDPLLALAEAEETTLTALYRRELERASRQAATRFRQIATTVQAAAEWTPPSVADVLDIQTNTARIRQGQQALLTAMAGTLNDAGLATVGGVGVTFAITAPPPQKLLNQLGARAEMLSEAIREPVAAAVARGWAEGASVPKTAAYIRQAALAATPAQATMLARTDLIGLSNGSNQWAVQELNAASEKNNEPKPFATKQWLSAGDARVRDTHQEADGQTVPIDDVYTVGGFSLAYPADPGGPNAEVCNCRCTEIYNERVRAPETTRPEPEAEAQIVNVVGTKPSQMVARPERPHFNPRLVEPHQEYFWDSMDETFQMLDDALTGFSDEAMARLDPVGGKLPVKVNADMSANGSYTYMGRSPMHIQMNPRRRDAWDHSAQNTLLHEFGHYLDHAVLSQRARNQPYLSQEAARPGSPNATAAMKQFVKAVRGSRQYKHLQELKREKVVTLDDGRTVSGKNKTQLNKGLAYLNSPQEQWARAFAHWMTRRYGSKIENDLLDEFIEAERRGDNTSGLDIASDWTAEEWEPIGKAVEAVLREAGLLADDGTFQFDRVYPRFLATLDRGDPLDRDLAADMADAHHPLDDLVFRPSVRAGLLRIDHGSDRTPPVGVVPFTGHPQEANMSAVEVETTNGTDAAVGAPWISDIAYEGLSTGDGRYMVDGSLRWRTPPLTLMSMMETTEGGHLGAQVAGRMDTFEKRVDNIRGEKLPQGVHSIRSTGVFDIGDWGADTERLVDNEIVTGISVDLAIHEWGLRDPDTGDIVAPEEATDEQWERAFMGDMEFAVIDAEIMAATVCPTPAFAEAKIALLASAAPAARSQFWRANAVGAEALGVPEGQLMTTLHAPAYEQRARIIVLASADAPESPLNPPRDVFFRPEADRLTPLTIDGWEVYGHLAPYDACHVGLINGAWSQCVTPPRSASGYQQFHGSGHVETAEGDIIPIGKLMVSDAGHAPASGTPAAARRYYDRNGAAGAYVRCVDGKLGIWFSGQVRPGITADQVHALRANAQSGDWRGNTPHDLELIAAVTVAVPGYAVPSQIGLAASADGSLFVSSMILTCQIGVPIGQTVEARAAAALMDGGRDALHALIAE